MNVFQGNSVYPVRHVCGGDISGSCLYETPAEVGPADAAHALVSESGVIQVRNTSGQRHCFSQSGRLSVTLETSTLLLKNTSRINNTHRIH